MDILRSSQTTQSLRLGLPLTEELPREMFHNTQQDSQRGSLILQLMRSQKDEPTSQFDAEEIEELEQRLDQIRARHQKQRMDLYDNYQTLHVKAREIAAEVANQCSSAASTARQSINYDSQVRMNINAQQNSSRQGEPTASFNHTLDAMHSGKITPQVSKRITNYNLVLDSGKRQQAQTPQVRISPLNSKRLCILSEFEDDLNVGSHEGNKVVRVKYNPIGLSRENLNRISDEENLNPHDRVQKQLFKPEIVQVSNEDSSLCIHGVIEEQQPQSNGAQVVITDEMEYRDEVDQSQNQNGQDEINTFLETITNLEAFDLKMKEASQDLGIQNKSIQYIKKRMGSTQRRENKSWLHLSNQAVSIDTTAIQLKEQLEKCKDAIGDNFLQYDGMSNLLGQGKSPQGSISGINMNMTTQQTPINQPNQSDKSGFLGAADQLGNTSMIQLREAIDVIIGKLGEKIEASALSQNTGKETMNSRMLNRCKDRAISNDFVSQKQSSMPKEFLLQQLGLHSICTEEGHKNRSGTRTGVRDSIETVKLNDTSFQRPVTSTNQLMTYHDESKFTDPVLATCEISQIKKKKKRVIKHKIGKTNSPIENSIYSFKVKHSLQDSITSMNDSRQALENNGDQEDTEFDKKEILTDEEGDVSPIIVVNQLRQSSTSARNIELRGTFQSAKFAQQSRESAYVSAEVMQTSFTEGDLNRSTTGGGMENEIRNLKSALGLLFNDNNMRVCSPKDFYGKERFQAMTNDSSNRDSIGINKTVEHHNEPPSMPFKFQSPNFNVRNKTQRSDKFRENSAKRSLFPEKKEQQDKNCKIF